MATRSPLLRRCVLGLIAAGLALPPCIAAPKKRRDSREDWQQPARVVADLGLTDGSRIADIGCGRGYFTYALAKAVGEKGMVYATEISEKSLKSVSDRVKADGLKNILPVLSDPADTKLDSNSLDAAFICNVLHHVPKEGRLPLVKDIARSLRPGGCFFIVDWRFDAKIGHDIGRRIPRDELVKLGSDAGLTLDAECYYLEHQVFLRFRKPTGGEKAPGAGK